MCTLIAARQGRRVVVAFNRDERLDRPTSPPQRLLEDPVAVGGRDDQEGGTWFGVARNGFFCGVVNRSEEEPRDPGRRSRGLLVLDVLRAGAVDAAGRALAIADSRLYNPFFLLFGDAGALRLVTGGGRLDALGIEDRAEGAHVWVSGPDPRSCEQRRRLVQTALPGLLARPWPGLVAGLERLLAAHDEQAPLGATCVHTAVYGTRSSTIVSIEEGTVREYLHADGPPCTHPFADVRQLVQGE